MENSTPPSSPVPFGRHAATGVDTTVESSAVKDRYVGRRRRYESERRIAPFSLARVRQILGSTVARGVTGDGE